MIDYLKKYMPAQYSEDSTQSSIQSDSTPDGIIFTDTAVLSVKYKQSQEEILSLLNEFIQASLAIGHHWELLDIGTGDFDYVLHRNQAPFGYYAMDWKAYASILQDYVMGMGWQTDIHTSLLIVGGTDVIPVPERTMGIDFVNTSCKLQVDMFYACFEDLESIIQESTNANKINYQGVQNNIIKKIRFNVSRIPLPLDCPSIPLATVINNTLIRSLENRAVISVNKAMMVSVKEWISAASVIAEQLPMVNVNSSSQAQNNIILSPEFDTYKKDSIELVANAVSESDLAFFNLHGAEDESKPNYYSLKVVAKDKNGEDISEDYCGWNIDLLPYLKAPLIHTIACYGARYHGYDIDESMLLSAFNNNALSFVGSSNIAIVYAGSEPRTCCSQSLMQIFHRNLLSGKYATGEALMRAKIEYFERGLQEGDFPNLVKYTIFEFNHYGNPLLKVNASCHSLHTSANYVQSSRSNYITKIKMDRSASIYRRSIDNVIDALYDDIRDQVDKAMADLEKSIREAFIECREDGVTSLATIENLYDNNRLVGYVFIYESSIQGNKNKVVIVTDLQGRITTSYETA